MVLPEQAIYGGERSSLLILNWVNRGVDGIIVSSHAGRQVDGAIATLDALENIVNAVGDQTYVCDDYKQLV